jgi:Xylanase inhibitor C-terminal
VPELCGDDSWFQSGMCVSLSEDDLAALPALSIRLGGVYDVVLSPADYMLRYLRNGKVYRCVGIMGMDGLGGMVVLGNTLMQRYVTVYDRTNSRIGFAEAAENCGE